MIGSRVSRIDQVPRCVPNSDPFFGGVRGVNSILHTNLFVGKIFFGREALRPTPIKKRGRWVYKRGALETRNPRLGDFRL